MKIVTHVGTGTEIVRTILRRQGAKLETVDTLDHAQRVAFDGLILLGGADINPFFYGERATWTTSTNKTRDMVEWTLVRRALSDRVPVFGICRGHQMITAAAGGALYQDIDKDGASNWHPYGQTHPLVGIHEALAERLPTREVNSLHHQAIKAMPFGFEIMALSEDGIVESIWRPGILGVQWHPELLYNHNRRWEALFEWFLEGLQIAA